MTTPPTTHALDLWRPQVLQYIDDHARQIVGSLRELIRIPSISGSDDENSIQGDMAAQLTGLGLDVDHWQIPLAQTIATPGFPGVEVERTEAWGLVGVAHGKGDGPSLMLNVHVDVVPPGDLGAWDGLSPFAGTVSHDAVRGRGACDMKGGVIAALWAVRAVTDLRVPLRGDLLLSSVQGEEDGGLGTFASLARGWRADACIIPEPTSLDVVPANAGSLTFRLTIKGQAAHASRRTSGISAIEKFLPIFQALRSLETDRNRNPDPLMARWDIAYPIEIGRVNSGDWSSSVPDLLTAEGRYGVALDETDEHARNEFVAAIRAACDSDAWLRDHPVDIQWWGGQFLPGRTDLDTSVITALRRAHSAVSPHRQQTWGAPYGSDLRLMNGIGGVPTVHYGPGDAALAHGPREMVPIDEVLTTARTLALVAMDMCTVG
ncbi:acetylornithine deacetylase [Nakamurella sp. UYEF19]|uniref:ArgE/DapE family deacylase n=1 Tax=Nakamurella sp. UYEF19 TaxID=1756392 RepID=UPI003398E30C